MLGNGTSTLLVHIYRVGQSDSAFVNSQKHPNDCVSSQVEISTVPACTYLLNKPLGSALSQGCILTNAKKNAAYAADNKHATGDCLLGGYFNQNLCIQHMLKTVPYVCTIKKVTLPVGFPCNNVSVSIYFCPYVYLVNTPLTSILLPTINPLIYLMQIGA